ncbi:MAG: hypothetical protein AAFO15_00390 [Pseudomonadota bacterium]
MRRSDSQQPIQPEPDDNLDDLEKSMLKDSQLFENRKSLSVTCMKRIKEDLHSIKNPSLLGELNKTNYKEKKMQKISNDLRYLNDFLNVFVTPPEDIKKLWNEVQLEFAQLPISDAIKVFKNTSQDPLLNINTLNHAKWNLQNRQQYENAEQGGNIGEARNYVFGDGMYELSKKVFIESERDVSSKLQILDLINKEKFIIDGNEFILKDIIQERINEINTDKEMDLYQKRDNLIALQKDLSKYSFQVDDDLETIFSKAIADMEKKIDIQNVADRITERMNKITKPSFKQKIGDFFRGIGNFFKGKGFNHSKIHNTVDKYQRKKLHNIVKDISEFEKLKDTVSLENYKRLYDGLQQSLEHLPYQYCSELGMIEMERVVNAKRQVDEEVQNFNLFGVENTSKPDMPHFIRDNTSSLILNNMINQKMEFPSMVSVRGYKTAHIKRYKFLEKYQKSLDLETDKDLFDKLENQMPKLRLNSVNAIKTYYNERIGSAGNHFADMQDMLKLKHEFELVNMPLKFNEWMDDKGNEHLSKALNDYKDFTSKNLHFNKWDVSQIKTTERLKQVIDYSTKRLKNDLSEFKKNLDNELEMRHSNQGLGVKDPVLLKFQAIPNKFEKILNENVFDFVKDFFELEKDKIDHEINKLNEHVGAQNIDKDDFDKKSLIIGKNIIDLSNWMDDFNGKTDGAFKKNLNDLKSQMNSFLVDRANAVNNEYNLQLSENKRDINDSVEKFDFNSLNSEDNSLFSKRGDRKGIVKLGGLADFGKLGDLNGRKGMAKLSDIRKYFNAQGEDVRNLDNSFVEGVDLNASEELSADNPDLNAPFAQGDSSTINNSSDKNISKIKVDEMSTLDHSKSEGRVGQSLSNDKDNFINSKGNSRSKDKINQILEEESVKSYDSNIQEQYSGLDSNLEYSSLNSKVINDMNQESNISDRIDQAESFTSDLLEKSNQQSNDSFKDQKPKIVWRNQNFVNNSNTFKEKNSGQANINISNDLSRSNSKGGRFGS